MLEQTNALTQILSNYFLQSTGSVCMAVKDDKIIYANNATSRMLGVPASDLLEQNVFGYVIDAEKGAFQKRIETINTSSEYFIVHMKNVSGDVFDLKCRLMPIIFNDSKIVMVEGLNETLAFALKKKNEALEEKMSHMSPVDLETRLPSLILLDDRIEQAILRALREAKGNVQNLSTYIMVMAVCINGLDEIEAQFGADGKREILEVLISRFKSSIRSVDSLAKDPDGYFYFLFEGIREHQNIDLIVERLQNCLSVPVLYKDKSIKFTISCGTSLYPEDGGSAVALIKAAKMNLTSNIKS